MRWYFSRREQVVMAFLLLIIITAMLFVSYSYGYRRADKLQGDFFDDTAIAMPTAKPTMIMVHVSGAVRQPGLYQFPATARVNDAIEKAGGAREDANAEELNLAEFLHDGEKIYLPTKGESADTAPPAKNNSEKLTTSKKNSSKTSKTPTKRIAINSASASELATLPGIGPTTAQHIIDYRSKHGPFRDTRELLNIPRLGVKTYQQLEPFISL